LSIVSGTTLPSGGRVAVSEQPLTVETVSARARDDRCNERLNMRGHHARSGRRGPPLDSMPRAFRRARHAVETHDTPFGDDQLWPSLLMARAQADAWPKVLRFLQGGAFLGGVEVLDGVEGGSR
jgi:hypothetical protein